MKRKKKKESINSLASVHCIVCGELIPLGPCATIINAQIIPKDDITQFSISFVPVHNVCLNGSGPL